VQRRNGHIQYRDIGPATRKAIDQVADIAAHVGDLEAAAVQNGFKPACENRFIRGYENTH
jgi:hypothetical protein